MTVQRAECQHCGAPLDPSHTGVCPHCGQAAGKKIHVRVTAPLSISSSLSWARTREYWEVNWPWLIIVVAISVASPFVGLLIVGAWGVVVGFLIGLVEFVVGVYAIGKVREITRGGSE